MGSAARRRHERVLLDGDGPAHAARLGDQVAKRVVGHKVLVQQWRIGRWRRALRLQPLLDRAALVAVAIRADDGVLHDLLSDGADRCRHVHHRGVARVRPSRQEGALTAKQQLNRSMGALLALVSYERKESKAQRAGRVSCQGTGVGTSITFTFTLRPARRSFGAFGTPVTQRHPWPCAA